MLISIIIPGFNEAEILEETIAHINHAIDVNRAQRNSWEIIVCDSNSSDETAQLASASGVTVVNEPTFPISKVRNSGAGSAQGDWMIFIDADTYPTPALLAAIIQVIESDRCVGFGTTVMVKGAHFSTNCAWND